MEQSTAKKEVAKLLARVNSKNPKKASIKNEQPYTRTEVRKKIEFCVGTIGPCGMAFILGSSFESWEKAIEEMEKYLLTYYYIENGRTDGLLS
jgi:hypothetical protein